LYPKRTGFGQFLQENKIVKYVYIGSNPTRTSHVYLAENGKHFVENEPINVENDEPAEVEIYYTNMPEFYLE